MPTPTMLAAIINDPEANCSLNFTNVYKVTLLGIWAVKSERIVISLVVLFDVIAVLISPTAAKSIINNTTPSGSKLHGESCKLAVRVDCNRVKRQVLTKRQRHFNAHGHEASNYKTHACVSLIFRMMLHPAQNKLAGSAHVAVYTSDAPFRHHE